MWIKILAVAAGFVVKYWKQIAGVIAGLYLRLLRRQSAAQKEEIAELRTKEEILEGHGRIEKEHEPVREQIRNASTPDDFNRVYDRMRDKK